MQLEKNKTNKRNKTKKITEIKRIALEADLSIWELVWKCGGSGCLQEVGEKCE